MRTTLVAGNWKMHKTHLESMMLVQQLAHELAGHNFDNVEVVVCPPFTALRTIQTLIDSDRYEFGLGAQNMNEAKEGAFTGEISPAMLKALNVSYVIIGHSERRKLFGETDDGVNSKVKAAFSHDMTPIVCVGETEDEHGSGATDTKVDMQVRQALKNIKAELVRRIVIAYEPIWAIGTGKTATPQDAQQTISYIRGVVTKLFGEEVASEIRILYGGSVKAGNAAALMGQRDIDGALVGGSSLDGAEFAAIVKASK